MTAAPEPRTAEVADRPDDDEMWVGGDEDGGVTIVCALDQCMRPGPVTANNQEGLYYDPIPVLPYRPSAKDVQAAWDAHLATHRNHA